MMPLKIRQQNIEIVTMLVDVNWIVVLEYIGHVVVNVVVEHLADDQGHAVVVVAAVAVIIRHHENVPIQKIVSVDKLSILSINFFC